MTNFQDSLAKWAGTTDELRSTAEWQAAVTAAVRAEEERQATTESGGGGGEVRVCFGVSDAEVRLGKVV